MKQVRKIKRRFVLQQDQSDCGVACLLSIIRYHNGESALESLRKLSGTSIHGTTLLGLCQAAGQSGFDAEGMEADGVDNLKTLSHPAILHVFIDHRYTHYLVFYGFQKEKLIIGDPARGILSYSRSQLSGIWQSKALLKLTPNENFVVDEVLRRRKKDWIVDLLRKDFPQLVIASFLGIVIAGLGLSTAIFSQKLIDDFLPKESTSKLFVSLSLVGILLLARSGLGYLRGYFLVLHAREFNNTIIRKFYSSLLRLPKLFFDTRRTGDLIARMNDTRRIQTVISMLAGNLLIDILILMASLTFAFCYSIAIGIVLLAAIPVYLSVVWMLNQPIIYAQKEVMRHYAMTESYYIDTIRGIATIKVNTREHFFENLNNIIYGSFQSSIFNLGKLNIGFGLITETISVIINIGVLGISSWLVLQKTLQLGEMVAVLGVVTGALPSITRLVIANIQIQEARVAFDRMFEFISVDREKNDTPTTRSLAGFQKTEILIDIKGLSFRFPGQSPLLMDITLEVKPGEWVVLLGESGCGKSTFLQIIQKFYQPESGALTVNGINWSELSIKEWRKTLGVVEQDIRIFNGSLVYNIALGSEPEDYQKVAGFCERLGFDQFFKALPQGYLTLLGEEGTAVSGGQKQLVALARALYKEPGLLLLDEATSAMDRNMENFVLSLLTGIKSETSILLITHRIKPARKADRIYVLKDGRTTISGSPDELLKYENVYSESVKELMQPD